VEVKIRPLEEKDAYTSVKWRNIPEIWALTGSAPNRVITIEDELTWVRRVTNDSSKRFAIMADDTYVGNTYLTNIEDSICEYHIFIGDKNYWGKGIARKASELIIDFAKDILHLKAINLEVNKDNGAAVHLYKSLGFKEKSRSDIFIQMQLELL
jgi:RimJ/RimL family protein N-acetyltransferase